MYEKVFISVWTLALSAVLAIFSLERIGISAEYTIRNRSLVNFSTPPLSTFGTDSVMLESSKHGRIADAGFPMMTLELVNPVPFTKLLVEGVTKRQVMHQGFYSRQGFEAVYGEPATYGILKYIDPEGVKQKLYVWLAWPDYDQSEHTIVYHFRTAVTDEIPTKYGISMTDPTTVLRGQISNIRLEIPYPSNS